MAWDLAGPRAKRDCENARNSAWEPPLVKAGRPVLCGTTVSLLRFPKQETKDDKAMIKLRTITMLALLTAAAATAPARAETSGTPETVTPQGEDAPGPDNGATVPPPAENKGVIPPPPTGDAGIHAQVPDPNAGTPEEVIPPPGTPGGNPDVEPR
jgi:hypothetical protein